MTAPPSLWKSSEFRYLLIGQTCAQLAAQISFLAIPLIAVLLLDATPGQMAVLAAAGSIPALIAGLHTGAVIDRNRRRPAMIGADLIRALLLCALPIAWYFGAMSLPLLVAVSCAVGLASLIFDVAYQALLANILDRDRAMEGNSTLELSRTGAELVGPGLAGQLIQQVGAALALLTNGLLYGISAVCVQRISSSVDPKPPRTDGKETLWHEVKVGLRAIGQNKPLRALLVGSGLLNFFNATLEVVFVLYVVRELQIGPGLLGFIFAIGGIGFLCGSAVSRFADRSVGFGIGTALAVVLIAGSDLLIPLSESMPVLIVPSLLVAQFLFGIGMTVFNVNKASLRQVSIPLELQGRASATSGFIGTAMVPIGAIAGGVLGEMLGLRATLYIAAIGELAVALWIIVSPVGRLRRLPTVETRIS